jgi:hypothetical protein
MTKWHKEYAKKWRQKNPKLTRLADRRKELKRIGATIELFNKMLEEQGGLCKICSLDFEKENKKPVIDHNHDTGKLRGILCQNCNMQLGHIERSKIKNFLFMDKAIEYLKLHNL